MSDTAPFVFISYSSANRSRVEAIADRLRASGVDIWFDQHSIDGGANWSSEIVEGIRNCAAVILVCSPNAMASRNVQQEIQLAWENNRPVLPLVIEAAALPPQIEYALAGRQWIDACNSNEDVWLPKALRALHGFGLPIEFEHHSHSRFVDDIGASPSAEAGLIPTNLVYQTTGIIGRENELTDIVSLLRSSRIVTLTGSGGTGKTRLSIEAGHRCIPAFPDGVFDVQLAPIIEASLVASAIARALDVREIQGQPILSSIKSFIYKRTMLLILDNFEHVLEARAVVSELLHSCPNLKILITSRVHLSISGEKEYAVEPLGVPMHTTHVSLDECLASSSVQLFIERAQGIRHDFRLTEENAENVAEICTQLDGLPLAIELAAARVKVLSLQAIRARLESRMKLLSSSDGDRPQRHQTLRNAIAWSYDLLDEREQRFFPVLGVFVGGFSLETAEDLVEELNLDVDAFSLVSSLVDKNLLKSEVAPSGDIRFRMLETMREFALDQLRTTQIEGTVRRVHAHLFALLSERAEPDFRAGLRHWVNVLQSEQDNIRAALLWSTTHNEPEVGMRIMGALTYWFFRTSYEEGRRWGEELIRFVPEKTDRLMRIKLLKTLGLITWGMSDVAAMIGYFKEAESLIRDDDDKHVQCEVLTWMILSHLMDRNQAHAVYEKALALTFEIDEKWLRSVTHLLFGMVEGLCGNTEEMARLMDESIAVSRSINDEWILAGALMFRGSLKAASGELNEARVLLEEAYAMFESVFDRKNLVTTSTTLADIARLQNDPQRASRIHTEALRICREIGEFGGTKAHLCGVALLLISQNDPYTALVLYSASQELFRRTGAPPQPFSDILSLDVAQVVEQQRQQLGESKFNDALNRGVALGFEEAIEFACDSLATIVV